MKTIFRVLLTSVMLMACSFASAQVDADEMLKRRCAEKVKQMCDYIEMMANPKLKVNNRLHYRSTALNLFIGQGDSYEEDGRTREGVMMEVTSVNKANPYSYLMKTYFTNLINRLKYSKVVMQTTDVSAMKVSELQPISDDTYVCTVYFEQSFCGYRDGRPVYKDITRKRVKCYVKVEQTEDGEEYIVMLGDVTATDTQRL